jgi:uncharacterized membrane protein
MLRQYARSREETMRAVPTMRPVAVLAMIGLLAAPAALAGLLAAPFAIAAAQAADPPLPVPPAAAIPEPGLSYRVVDVAADDVLNIRDQPGITAPIVATLSPDAAGVRVTGVRQPVGPSMWWEVIHPGIDRDRGWVNARFLAAEEVAPETNFALQCGGTEPFWSLDIAEGQADFDLLGGAPASWDASPWMDAAGFVAGYRFAVRLDRPSPAATGWATISRAMDFCTDQMSDRRYPYDMTLITPDEEIFSGCCERAP